MSTIPLSAIRADVQAQPRASINTDLVAEYSEAMLRGDAFPPIVVFFDGETHWLADGFHRFYAAQGCEQREIAADAREGDLRDAILYSVGANAAHGARRTDEDRRRAILRLLHDPEWRTWSDREIARRCGVSPTTVARTRADIGAFFEGKPVDEGGKYRPGRRAVYESSDLTAHVDSDDKARTYQTKHGSVTTMNTAAIGRKPTPDRREPIDEYIPDEEPSLPEPSPESRFREHMSQGDTALFGDMIEIERLWLRLPSPSEFTAEFPVRLRHAFNSERFVEMADWFLTLSKEWDDLLEASNVAAE